MVPTAGWETIDGAIAVCLKLRPNAAVHRAGHRCGAASQSCHWQHSSYMEVPSVNGGAAGHGPRDNLTAMLSMLVMVI